MKAWQREVRERVAAQTPAADLFGSIEYPSTPDIASAVVRPIEHALATRIIEEYEWLGKMPIKVWFTYGIFFDGVCAGAVAYAPDYVEHFGVWDKYGFRGKLICLARGACAHWAHPHSASKLIRRSMELLPPRFKVVTATVDARAGEVGTIYQACGFDYVGALRQNGIRHLLMPNGKLWSERSAARNYGNLEKAMQAVPGAKLVTAPPKGRYFAFRGTRGEIKRFRAAIAPIIKPYPKRDKVQEGTGGYQPQGVGQFDGPAPLFEGVT